MLHQSVACIITALLESGPELRLKVFTVGDLHSRISKEGLCEENTGPNRHGIMGYLTRLSVMIQSEAQTCAEIRDLLEKCEDWAKYETSDLEECKKAERAGPAVDEDELSSEEDVDDDEDVRLTGGKTSKCHAHSSPSQRGHLYRTSMKTFRRNSASWSSTTMRCTCCAGGTVVVMT